MNWGKIGTVAMVIVGGLWLEARLTGTAFTIDLLNPIKSTVANPPAGSATNHPSAQAGA